MLGAVLALASKVLAAWPAARAAMGARPRLADYAEILTALDAVCGTASSPRMPLRAPISRGRHRIGPVGVAVHQLLEEHPAGGAAPPPISRTS